MEPRPYQLDALASIKNRTSPRGIVALPTGTGKGHIAGHISEAIGSDRILYLAHREELIDQLVKHVERVTGYGSVTVEMAKERASGFCDTVVASVPTLATHSGRRLKSLDQERFDAIVVDEAHHATARGYLKIFRHFGILGENNEKISNPRIPLIGLTATPSRGDGVGLSNVFDDIWYQMTLTQAIDQGWLVPVHAFTLKSQTKLDGIKTRCGDFAEGELAAAVDTLERNAMVLDACRTHAAGMKTLIFAVNINHAKHIAELINEHGMEARWVSGAMPKDERRATLDWYRKTDGAILVNCQLITEGVDIPSVQCVIMAGPTKSRVLYAQRMGRGTRLAEGAANYAESVALGKDRCLVIDVTDCIRHTGTAAVRIGDLFGAPLPDQVIEGREMREVVQTQQEELLQMEKGALLQFKTALSGVDLFSNAKRLPAYCRMAWITLGDCLSLSMGDGSSVRIESDALDRPNARLWVAGKPMSPGRSYGSHEEAVRAVEDWVVQTQPKKFLRLQDRQAGWRTLKPTPKQLSLATHLGLTVPRGATRGQLSAAIDAAKVVTA